MEKISIVIPVYNVKDYLMETLNSVIHQTYKNLEIILVDDGSTDGSSQLCDNSLSMDSRIKVIHQKNTGLSGARNTGMENSTGKYIMFIDSDDLYEENSCEVLFNLISSTKSDFVTGNYRNMDEDSSKWVKPVFSIANYPESPLLIEDYKVSFYLMNSGVWNKIFRKSFLDKIKIKFIDKIPAEDAAFTTLCFIKAHKVYYCPEIVYNYRLRNSGSISTSCSKDYFVGINKAYRIIYNNFKNNDQLEFYRYFYAKSMNYILYKFIDSETLTKQERVEILVKMKWFYVLSYELKIPTILKSVQYIIESIYNKDFAQALKYCEILSQVRKMLPKEIKEKMSKPNADTYQEIENNMIDLELLELKNNLQEQIDNTNITILSIEDSIFKIKNERKSLSRFGDGELDLIIGKNLKFQEHNEKLSKRLQEVLTSKQDSCLIGIPDVINGFINLTDESEAFWIKNMSRTRKIWLQYLDETTEYCTANLTRLYIRHKDKSNCGLYFSMLKSIWDNKNVILCEGEQSRVGVGNDLLDNCKSIKRILCPAEDAFDKYDEILNRLKKESKDCLILMALGPTATVLAYDLSILGYQALDLGHFDIEYEWFKRNATKKEKIQNKYTNEVNNGNTTIDVVDFEYNSQIDTIIK